MEAKKKKALFILGIAGLLCIAVSLFLTIITITFFPLLVTFTLILLGMLGKWFCEWCIRNIHIFKIGERSKKVKEKLKIDEGIKVVKDSYEILRNKEEKNETM